MPCDIIYNSLLIDFNKKISYTDITVYKVTFCSVTHKEHYFAFSPKSLLWEEF